MTSIEREQWIDAAVAELVKQGYNRTEGLRAHAGWLADKYPALTPAQAVKENMGEPE